MTRETPELPAFFQSQFFGSGARSSCGRCPPLPSPPRKRREGHASVTAPRSIAVHRGAECVHLVRPGRQLADIDTETRSSIGSTSLIFSWFPLYRKALSGFSQSSN